MSTRISKNKGGSYNITLQDPTTNIRINNGCRVTLKDAKELAREYDLNFYKDKTYLLPKGIAFSTRDRVFLLNIHHPKRDKSYSIGNYTTVEEAKKARLRIIQSLLDL